MTSDLLELVFNAPGKRGCKHADDLRTVVNAMLYIAQTGCQWRYLPRVVRTKDSGLVAVPPLIAQWHLGARPDGAACGRTPRGRQN